MYFDSSLLKLRSTRGPNLYRSVVVLCRSLGSDELFLHRLLEWWGCTRNERWLAANWWCCLLRFRWVLVHSGPLEGGDQVQRISGMQASCSRVAGPAEVIHFCQYCGYRGGKLLVVLCSNKLLFHFCCHQIAPADLEAVLVEHPEIVDVAVTSWVLTSLGTDVSWSAVTHLNLIPRICVSIDSAEDEEAGEIPVAFVVRKSGSGLSCTQVMEYVSKQVKKVEKVYINPSPMGVGRHNPPNYEMVYITPWIFQN